MNPSALLFPLLMTTAGAGRQRAAAPASAFVNVEAMANATPPPQLSLSGRRAFLSGIDRWE